MHEPVIIGNNLLSIYSCRGTVVIPESVKVISSLTNYNYNNIESGFTKVILPNNLAALKTGALCYIGDASIIYSGTLEELWNNLASNNSTLGTAEITIQCSDYLEHF